MRLSGSLSGILGDTSSNIYAQVIAQGGTAAQAEAAARSGSLSTFTTSPSQQLYVPDWFKLFWNTPAPSIKLDGSGVAPYKNLSDTHLSFAQVVWNTPISNPHYTNALDWVTPNVLNKGNPKSIYDPEEYLRSALIDSDWEKVFYWFAVHYQDLYKRYTNWKDAFFPFANMNILSYKYVIDDNGNKVYFPFSAYDLKMFLSKIVANFTIADIGGSKCAIGLLNWGDPYHVVAYDLTQLNNSTMWWVAIAQGLNDPLHPSSVFQYTPFQTAVTNAQLPRVSSSPNEDVRVGWVQGPKGPWTFDTILSIVVIAIISYYAGAALGPVISGLFSTGTAAVTETGVTAATVASTTSATSAVATTAVTSALDEVVITGTVASLSTVGGALAAGAVVAATAPAIVGATAPSISAPTTSAPASGALDEITITGSAAAPVSTVAGAVTAGSVVATTAPAIVNTTAPDLQEVTITGSTPAPTSTVGGAISAGAVVGTTAPAIANTTAPSITDNSLPELTIHGSAPDPMSSAAAIGTSIVSTAASAVSQAANSSGDAQNDQPKQGESSKDWLERMAKKYGANWVKSHLAALLKAFLKRPPTHQDYIDAGVDDGTDSGSSFPWGLIFVVGAAIVGGS